MGEAAVRLRGKRHVVPCGAEPTSALADCAAALDKRLAELDALSREGGKKAAEPQLILMAALALVQELNETRTALKAARQDAARAEAAFVREAESRARLSAAAAEALTKAARRLEMLSGDLG